MQQSLTVLCVSLSSWTPNVYFGIRNTVQGGPKMARFLYALTSSLSILLTSQIQTRIYFTVKF